MIVDTHSNDDRVYTQMYIQWNANEDSNYMRVGIKYYCISIEFDKFKWDKSNIIEYVGFSRLLIKK